MADETTNPSIKGLLTFLLLLLYPIQLGAPSLLEKEPDINLNKRLCICRFRRTS